MGEFDYLNEADERHEHVYGTTARERNDLHWQAADRIADMALVSPDQVPPGEVRQYIRDHYHSD